MKHAYLILPTQRIECIGNIKDGVFLGEFTEEIEDRDICNVWKEFEEIVESMSLSLLDEAENNTEKYKIEILIDGRLLNGNTADLQIYPASKMISFRQNFEN